MIKINWLYFEVPNSFYNDFEDLFIIKNTIDPSVFSTLPTMYIYIHIFSFLAFPRPSTRVVPSTYHIYYIYIMSMSGTLNFNANEI